MWLAGCFGGTAGASPNQLRELYNRNDCVVVLEAALDGKFGTRTLFTVESKTAPTGAGGLASFNLETIIETFRSHLRVGGDDQGGDYRLHHVRRSS
jgi:hypothetical protein